MSWTRPERMPWVERLNALGENLGAGAASLVSLDPETILDAARQATGLADFGDDSFREPLDVFCRSLEEEAALSLLGRLMARAEIQRLLQNRLGIEATYRAHPEIEDEEIRQPVFVTGLGRSGTSLLHELLAQDPANRTPLLWEMMRPVPPPERASYDTDPRAGAADREIKLMDAIIPAVTAMHENAGDLPNECIFIFAHQFATDMWIGEYRVPSYTGWMAGADLRPSYAWHERFLKLLQWRYGKERWVLKAPSHLSALPTLFDVYPDARVVMTHRDPLRVLGSLSNLMATLQLMRTEEVDREGCVRAQAGGFPYLLERMMKLRDEGGLPGDQVVDVRYADLVAEPAETVRALYALLGLELGVAADEALRAHVAAQSQGRRALHDYRFDDTGLDRDTERAKYTAYMDRFGVPEEV